MFSPGNAETNVMWGRKVNNHLMASCIKNTRTKNYQNMKIGFQVTVENVGDVFGTLRPMASIQSQRQAEASRVNKKYFGLWPIQEGAAVEGPPATGPSLQLSTDRRRERPLPWQRGHPGQGGKGSLRHLPNIKLSDNRQRSYGDFLQTTQLAAVTLTSDPLTL